jgi:hypothetical protein
VGYANLLAKHIPGYWNGYSFCINNFDAGYCTTPGHLLSYVASGAQEDACTNNPVANDIENWFHITNVYSHTTNQNFLYINGILQSDIGQKSGNTSNTVDLLFGGFPISPNSPFSNYSSHYKGLLDDIRIYNRALSASEVMALTNEVNQAALNLSKLTSKVGIVQLFPNPAVTKLNVVLNENVFKNATMSYTIETVDAKVLKSDLLMQQNNTYEIDIKDLPKGFYILNIKCGEKSEVNRFIKD